MTDRDHFAAAALTGFASQPRFNCGSVLTLTAKQCYELADAMLRERSRAGQNSSGGTESAAKCTERDSANHDAAPAATANAESVAPQPTAGDRAGNPPSHSGTGDTPKPISGCVSDRSKPINGPDPDSRVWETPVHTPAPHATPGEGSEQRECTEPVAWGVANGKGLLATSISRIDAVDMQSDYACDTEVVPLYRHPPVTEPMPKEKRAEVCAGPLAWAAIRENGQPLWLSYDRSGAEGMVNGMAEVVPLYRKPTLTDAEREAVERASIAYELLPTEGAQQVSATLRGLLGRLGGGR